MSKLYLKLEDEDGNVKEYRKEKIKAHWVKRAFQHAKELDKLEKAGDANGMIDARLEFTCEVFGKEGLTPDAILNGLESDELFPTLDKIYNTVMGKNADEEDRSGKS